MKKFKLLFLPLMIISVVLLFVLAYITSLFFLTSHNSLKTSDNSQQVKTDKNVGDPDMSNFANWKDLKYQLKATLDPEKMQLTATQTTSFMSEELELSEIHFHLYSDSYNSFEKMPSITESKDTIKRKYPNIKDEDLLGDITIQTVKVNNKDISFTQDHQDLNIQLGETFKPKTPIQVTMSFSLKIPYSTQRLGFFDDVYSLTQWYPLLSKYNTKAKIWDTKPFDPIGETDFVDAANYEVEIQAPEKMTITSSGRDTDVTKQDGKQTLKTSLENARHFVFIASSIFKIKYYDTDFQKVRFAYRDTGNNKEEKIDEMANIFTKAINFFNQKIYKHHAEEFDIVETGVVGFAMEYSGLVQMGNYDKLVSKRVTYDASIIVHELGHQWFYWNVGSDSYHEACMDEGFTTYITTLFFQENFKNNYFNLTETEKRFISTPHSACDPISHYHEAGNKDHDYFNTAYNVTTQILTDLGDEIGRDKLSEILNDYSTTYSYQFGGLKRFCDILEKKTSKQIATWFYKSMTTPNYQKNSTSTT